MRYTLTVAATLAAVFAIRRFWKKPTATLLTRIPVATHPDSKPRFRTWRNGVEVFDH